MNLLLEKTEKGFNYTVMYDELSEFDIRYGNLKTSALNVMPYYVYKKNEKCVNIFLNFYLTNKASYINDKILSTLSKLNDLSYKEIKTNFLKNLENELNRENYLSKSDKYDMCSLAIVVENKILYFNLNDNHIEQYDDFRFEDSEFLSYLYENIGNLDFESKIKLFHSKVKKHRKHFYWSCYFVGNTEDDTIKVLFGEDLNNELILTKEDFIWE